jgi:pimeloyl-ACP methyl ester carboxylesterase
MSEPQLVRLPVADGQSIALDWYAAGDATPALLLVHGLGSHRRGEKALHFAAQFAAAGHSVASVDLRGHGDSDGTMRELTMGRMLADVAVATQWVRSHCTAQPPVLMGVSMGAAVAAWHALRAPHEVGALILIAPSLAFPTSLTRALAAPAQAQWRRTGLHRFRSQWLDLQLGVALLEEAESGAYDWTRLARTLQAPWLIVHGVRDEVVPWQNSVEFLRAAANVAGELYLIGAGDHRLTAHKQLLFEISNAWLGHRAGVPPA